MADTAYFSEYLAETELKFKSDRKLASSRAGSAGQCLFNNVFKVAKIISDYDALLVASERVEHLEE